MKQLEIELEEAEQVADGQLTLFEGE